MRYADKFEAFETNAGKYSNRKVPRKIPKGLLSLFDLAEDILMRDDEPEHWQDASKKAANF